ncbi:glutamate receptor ionotropic, kainate glr-3-like [Macrobrachium rosenbergii]|uniref:glutamate receptor ionotropic, kainate glr-3-like n=1 Tax=Macrobrachium rosenbergii TaxID=79674 RepID=UPI0034D5C563
MALRGRHLKVGADVWSPWVSITEEPNGTLTSSGIAVGFLNTIASVMNFTYTVIKPLDGEWGRELGNGSFSGMIGMCQRKEVDIALGPFVMSWDRYQAADFSTTIHFDQYGILVPRPVPEADLAGITKPLAWQVWMWLSVAICISIVIGFLLNIIMRQLSADGLEYEEDSAISPSWIAKVMLSETVSPEPANPVGRTYLLTWMMAGLILQAAYSGVLTSLLAVPKVTIPVDSLEDLLSYGKFPWIIEQGSYLHNTFLKAKTGLYKAINDGGTHVLDFYTVKEWAKKGKFAVLVPLTSMKKLMSEEYSEHARCDYYIAKNHILSAPFALAFPKGSQLIQHFNKWLNFLKESGEVSRSILGETKNATACLVRPGKEPGKSHKPFSVMDLSGTFVLISVGKKKKKKTRVSGEIKPLGEAVSQRWVLALVFACGLWRHGRLVLGRSLPADGGIT